MSVFSGIFLFGCTRDPKIPKTEPGTVLIDFFRAAAAAVEEDGHYELVLSSTNDPNRFFLDQYTKETSCEEICTRYLVPAEAAIECYKLIEAAHADNWGKSDGGDTEVPDGLTLVLKYYYGGRHIRISADEVPESALESISLVESHLSSYLKDEYLVENE